MPRQPTPWKRGDTGAWYAWVANERVWLAPGEASKTEAQSALDQVKASVKREARRPGTGLTFREAVGLFMFRTTEAVAKNNLAHLTMVGYLRYLEPADAALGKIPISSLQPHHVQAWLDSRPAWGPSTRNTAITCVKACLNWCVKQGHIPTNPIRDMVKPRANVTETDLTPEQSAKIRASVPDQEFRDLLTVMWGTGMRPSEAMRLEASHLDLEQGVATMFGKTSRKTGRMRIIYFSAEALEVVTRLAVVNPAGPILRNTKGNPWITVTVAGRMIRIRRRLGMGPEVVPKGFRHAFASDALVSGVPIATVAELMGHASTTMISKHYSKLRKRTDYLAEAVRKIRPKED